MPFLCISDQKQFMPTLTIGILNFLIEFNHKFHSPISIPLLEIILLNSKRGIFTNSLLTFDTLAKQNLIKIEEINGNDSIILLDNIEENLKTLTFKQNIFFQDCNFPIQFQENRALFEIIYTDYSIFAEAVLSFLKTLSLSQIQSTHNNNNSEDLISTHLTKQIIPSLSEKPSIAFFYQQTEKLRKSLENEITNLGATPMEWSDHAQNPTKIYRATKTIELLKQQLKTLKVSNDQGPPNSKEI